MRARSAQRTLGLAEDPLFRLARVAEQLLGSAENIVCSRLDDTRYDTRKGGARHEPPAFGGVGQHKLEDV